MHYITTQKYDKVVDELKRGKKSQAEIAKEVGISKSSVYRIACQIGIKHYKSRKANKKSGEQLCWTCSKACGGCNWSESFKPVKGWTAESVVIGVNSPTPMHTYHISECPEYERE